MTIQSNILRSTPQMIVTQAPFLLESSFWLLYLKIDYGRLRKAEGGSAIPKPLLTQKKIVVTCKIFGDGLRLLDVVGRKFESSFNQPLIRTARIVGLFFGCLDALNEQVLTSRELRQKISVKNTLRLCSNIFFYGFSLASILQMHQKLERNSRPIVMISLMGLSILGSCLTEKIKI
jgi:hypothetical protein